MKINNETLVILIPGFPDSETDSTCLPSQQSFVRSLRELYPQLNIIILSFQYPYHTKKYNWFEIPVIPFSGRNKGGLPRLIRQKKIGIVLNQIRQTNKIIGLLSFWCGECALVGKKFSEKYDIPHFCWIRGQDARKENKFPRRIEFSGQELIALSDFLQDEFERNHHIRPQYVVPPGINLKQFPENGIGKDIDILAVGSLIPLKQYDIFLQVISEIKKQFPQIKAVLIGDGPEKANLENLIVKLNLESSIIFAGELSHSEVLQYMQRAKIFLHPSSYEGFSGVCLEALCSGAHVISLCKAMNRHIEHWHIINNKKEMEKKAIALLMNSETEFSPVIACTMEDSVKKIIQLFYT